LNTAYTYELGSDYGVVLLGENEDIGDCYLRFRSIEDADTAQLSRLEVVMPQSLKTVYCESRCDAMLCTQNANTFI